MHRPNKPETGASHPEDDHGPRYHSAGTGDPGKDGYNVYARRPRTRYTTESVDPKKATEIEKAIGKYSR